MALLQINAFALCLAVMVCNRLGLATPISQYTSSFPSHLNPLPVSLSNYQTPPKHQNIYTPNPLPVVYSPTPIYKPNQAYESRPNIVVYEPQFRQDPKPKIVTQVEYEPKPTYEPPHQAYQSPKQTYEPPIQTYVSPIKTYEPRIQTYEPHVHISEPIVQSYEPPPQNYEPPQQNYEPLKQTYEPPQPNYEPPKPTYEPPKQNYESKSLYQPQPTHEITPIYRPEPIRSYRPDVEIYKEDAKPYSFDYGVRDSYHGTNFGHSQQSDGKEVKGSYTVALPDGRIQKVTYTADHHNGFQAVVTYEGEAKFPEFIPRQKYEPIQHIHSPPIYQPTPQYSNANVIPSYNPFPNPVYSQF